MNHPFFKQQAQRRERRLASFSRVGEALRREAGSGWDLKERLNSDSFGRPATLPETIKKVIATVRDTLDQLGEFPVPPVIEYQSIRSVRSAAGGTEQTPLIEDGVIMLHARFLTKTGVRDSFDVPVLVREGQVLPPSVIMHEGTMKVLAPSSVREMVARGTFTQQAPSRGLFSGPLTHEEVTQWNQIERDNKMQTRLNPGMFTVSSARDLVRAAVRGDAAFDKACMEHEAQTAEYDYKLRGTDQDQSGTLYDLCKVLDSSKRNTGASIVRSDGTMVAFYDDAQRTVAPTSQANEYERSTCEDVKPFLRGAQLGDQPSRASMGFKASPGTRVGDRIMSIITWDPENVESMSDQNIHHSIRSFVLELGTKKEWRDWGTIADVQIDEFDRGEGSARVSFKSSEISAPQLSAAEFEGLEKKGAMQHEAAYCEKCKVNHRPGTKCPHANKQPGGTTTKAPESVAHLPSGDVAKKLDERLKQVQEAPAKAPKAPKAPKKPPKTNLSSTGEAIAAKAPPEDAPPHEHMAWALDNIADALKDAQEVYGSDMMRKKLLNPGGSRSPGQETRAADQLVTKLMNAYQGAVMDAGEKVRSMPEGQEKQRAQKIVNMIGSQFSFGGRGLDRQRDPEKTKRIMERVKPLYDEVTKLTGGQMQMFARSAGWNDPQAKQIEQLLQSGVAPSTSPAMAGMIWDELKQHPQMNETEASTRLQYGRTLDLLNALVDGGILDRSTNEPASGRPRADVQYTLKIASRRTAQDQQALGYRLKDWAIHMSGNPIDAVSKAMISGSEMPPANVVQDAIVELERLAQEEQKEINEFGSDPTTENRIRELRGLADELKRLPSRSAAIGPSQDETDLQPAERDKEDQFHVGEEVKLTKGQLLRNRGGGVDTIPKGTVGKVVGDMFGDGLTLKIVFEEVSLEPMVIPASHVKHASSVTAEKVITEIANLRHAGYSPIDVILTARQRYGALGEEALKQAKTKGLLDW